MLSLMIFRAGGRVKRPTTGQKDVLRGTGLRVRDRKDLRTGQQEAPGLQDGP